VSKETASQGANKGQPNEDRSVKEFTDVAVKLASEVPFAEVKHENSDSIQAPFAKVTSLALTSAWFPLRQAVDGGMSGRTSVGRAPINKVIIPLAPWLKELLCLELQ
jgi:hypothetical protein